MNGEVHLPNKWSYVKGKEVELSHLHPVDGFLYLTEEDPQLWIQNNQAKIRSVRHLELQLLQVENISDSIGELSNLTHLSITYGGSLKCVPNTILSMHNLQYLYLHGCKNLLELPHNLGDLGSLTHLRLTFCKAIISLPTSVVKLNKLTTLEIKQCEYLGELPGVSSVKELTLLGCCITSGGYYRGHCLPFCKCVEVRFTNLKDFVSLRHLTYGCGVWNMLHQLPESMDKLQHLMLLDIHYSNLRWLPHNIAMLPKLRFLFLPRIFRVETLPFHLDDSIVISVEYTHVRKSWKELKTEMLELFSSPMVGIDPSEYLPLKGDPDPWIRNNVHLHSLVRILDLELFHLHDPCAGYLSHLPHTFSRIIHISLYGYELGVCVESLFDSLPRLSTLESLQLDFETFPTDMMDLPDSLKRLTLHMHPLVYGQLNSIPECITKLSNLKTLELFKFCLESLPTNMNLFKLKLMDSTIKSLPIGLQHLEIIHSLNNCDDEFICCDEKLQFLLNNQLNSMKTLSVTCWEIKTFPRIELHNLQELQLKDCFNLIALSPNIDELVNLCTINLSGTRISSLPDSISKLPNLQHLILPKCFRTESMSSDFKKAFNVFTIDDTYDKYYGICDHICGGSSIENSNKHGEFTSRVNEVVLQESEEDIIGEQQQSPQQLLNLPDAAPIVRGQTGSPSNGRDNIVGEDSNQTICSSQNQTMETLSPEIPSEDIIHDENNKNPRSENIKGNKQRTEITLEDIERLIAKNMTLVDAGKELGVSRSTMKRRCREVGINEWPLSRKASLKHLCTNKKKQNSNSSSGSSSNYIVKANYKDDTVRFNCSFSTCFVDLKKDMAKNLEIELGTFKVKYQDEEKDWVLMTTDDHLKDALVGLMKSNEDNVLRLLVIEL